ncbi:Protein of unknown function [Desulfotomaculum arcticum]|uniref:DUF2889 domain-containing protein n=1 Tax=Desulfotruncus arcticus DSM 17038 TaxID=1121424 RepID=A0A1I2N7G7_9FIRM|nr:DUF2889 domain-containing protein [Desulfotruncus arcticus]SFF99804.1 Protein of unknown function [Desulfotomaculum arcticum] [Desulfotruncus arcticus DSM 17038]
MPNILQRHWQTHVRQVTGDVLEAQTIYCGTDGESGAMLTVEAGSFKIIDALLESYSPPAQVSRIDGLLGEEAYFNCGPVLKRAVGGLGELPRSLFAETVRGIIQAETFIWEKRGYASSAAYSDFWEKFYLGSCRYYSNLDKISQKWDEYVAYPRSTNLFNRFKQQSVDFITGKGYGINVKLSDSFHEMNLDLELDLQYKIVHAAGSILRAPDLICFEATQLIENLEGQFITQLDKKQIAKLLGMGNGCVHLIDMVNDGVVSSKIVESGGGII